MSDISQLAHVLRQYEVFRKGPAKKGGGDFHKGLIHLRNVDQDRVAERVLQRDWHSRKAVASMFKMAESVERLALTESPCQEVIGRTRTRILSFRSGI